MVNKPLYGVWRSMKARCYSPSAEGYKYYGGRGITVCDRWLESYENFASDMGDKPTPVHTLDRIDNDGNYTPENCRWATKYEQVLNRRPEQLPRTSNKSGAIGVRQTGNRWEARGRFGKHIGSYATKEEAIVAREEYIKQQEMY